MTKLKNLYTRNPQYKQQKINSQNRMDNGHDTRINIDRLVKKCFDAKQFKKTRKKKPKPQCINKMIKIDGAKGKTLQCNLNLKPINRAKRKLRKRTRTKNN